MALDINQMNYLINIVECGCNLSLAAKKIHISQSALSQFVTNFENDEEVLLFNRKNGRLEGLTDSGEKVYRHSLDIIQKYNEMQEVIQRESSKQKGTIRVGLPSLILRVYFAEFFPTFALQNPDIQIEITEGGSNELRQMLLNNDLDYAILIDPTSLDPKGYEQNVIQIDEMTAFMDIRHPLSEKELLEWRDLDGYPLATFNKSFTTYELISTKLKKEKVEGQIRFTSSSWDYLIEATRDNDIVTILPRPVDQYTNTESFKVTHFRDFVPFNFFLIRPIKDKYGEVETIVYETILNYFYQPIEPA